MIGAECIEIPATVTNADKTYSVTSISYGYEYDGVINQIYTDKLIIPETVTGSVHLDSLFHGLSVVEFKGTTAPSFFEHYAEVGNDIDNCIYIVPKGSEEAYQKAIHEYIDYSAYSDLYEKSINIEPVIINSADEEHEFSLFVYKDRIYRITKAASDSTDRIGEVELIGYYGEFEGEQFSILPEFVNNHDYTYRLTKLTRYSLIGERKTTVVIPDSVIEMEDYCMDKYPEVLFLSKNCPVIGNLISDENGESALRFVYIPEGVTTIAKNAFSESMANGAEVIIPKSVSSIGSKALSGFSHIEFISDKPVSKLSKAIAKGTTISVSSDSMKAYKKALSKISGINFIKSAPVRETTDITVHLSETEETAQQVLDIGACLTRININKIKVIKKKIKAILSCKFILLMVS